MALSPDQIAELRVAQLDMLQSVIARIAGYGATIKNWCITLVTAVCGFSITIHKPFVVLLALLPIVAFAILDAQYLRVERQFRETFDAVRRESWDLLPNFAVNPDTAAKTPLGAILRSWSIAIFYLPLLLGIVVLLVAEILVYGQG